jgi:hypothetical protein
MAMKIVESSCRVLASYLLEDHVTTRVSLGKISEIIDLNTAYRQ